jgi:potassium-dependent mechanosensitive channel
MDERNLRLQALWSYLDDVLLMLERPVVQRQLVAFLIIVIGAWLLAWAGQRLVNRLSIPDLVTEQAHVPARRRWRRRLKRWLLASEQLFYPLMAIVLGRLAVEWFHLNGWRSGLLAQWASFFWLLGGYRVVVALLYAATTLRLARAYHQRVLLPLFLFLVSLVLFNSLAGTIALSDVELLSLLGQTVTLGQVVVALVIFYAFLVAAWLVQDVLGHGFLPRSGMNQGLQNAVLTISRYTLIGTGALATASVLGFDLSTLAIIGGGLSVGIGFGLQDIVSNFISGMVLLFEQTLRPGDIVEVEGQRGVVSSLRIRSTLVRTPDNVELIVPNKTLLTSTVSTYTQSDRMVRLHLDVGVSYNSDPEAVRDTLLRVAERHGRVLKKPEPKVFFRAFGSSSLDFRLAVWIDDPLRQFQVLSDLHFMVFHEFKKYQIEIPFPQQDLHLRSSVA